MIVKIWGISFMDAYRSWREMDRSMAAVSAVLKQTQGGNTMSETKVNWVDDTKNWKLADTHFVHDYAYLEKGNMQIYLTPSPDNDKNFNCPPTSEYRTERCSNTFRILKRVEEPVFTWTVKTVAAINWKELSEVKTLEACRERWIEVRDNLPYILSHGNEPGCSFGVSQCPACQKWYGDDCPLGIDSECSADDGCCGGYFALFNRKSTLPNAQAVLAYIEQKLEKAKAQEELDAVAAFDEAEYAAKCKKWEPKLGNRVEVTNDPYWKDDEGNSIGTIVALHDNKVGALLFNSEWTHGIPGNPEEYSKGCPVPGHRRQHYYVSFTEMILLPENSNIKR